VANWRILSRGSPSLYANPPPFESEVEIVKMTRVALSIRTQEQKQKKEEEERPPAEVPGVREESEEGWSVLENPSRVTLNQLPGIDLNYSESYRPVCGEVFHGFLMLKEIGDEEDDDDDK
jgi:hypothetical protein